MLQSQEGRGKSKSDGSIPLVIVIVFIGWVILLVVVAILLGLVTDDLFISNANRLYSDLCYIVVFAGL